MSERAELIRQRAREEAAEREQRFATARVLGTVKRSLEPDLAGRVRPPAPGETACPFCGTRSSIGCQHARPA